MDLSASTATEIIKKISTFTSASEEKEFISQILASIRTEIKTDIFRRDDQKYSNLIKILYCHLLGYSVQWAYLECIHLLKTSSFTNKRIGYLAFSLMLDENQDILMLATNTILADLKDHRFNVASLALVSIANVGDQDLLRNAMPIILKIASNSRNKYSPALQAKALMCAVKLVRKLPEYSDLFFPVLEKCFKCKNNSIIHSCVSLLTQLVKSDPEGKGGLHKLQEYIPLLTAVLQRSRKSDSDYEEDADPILRIKILRLISALGLTNQASIDDKLIKVVEKIASNTGPSTHSTNTVTYECIKTLLTLKAHTDARETAIDLIDNLLTHQHPNSRAVALNLLLSLVNQQDKKLLLRYHTTIIKFLRPSPDCKHRLSYEIHSKAIKLIAHLADRENVKVVVKEVMEGLRLLENQLERREVSWKILDVIERYAPSRVWYIHNTLQVLKMGDLPISDSKFNQFISVFHCRDTYGGEESAEEVRLIALQEMYDIVCETIDNQQLLQVCFWCLGEGAALLHRVKATNDPSHPHSAPFLLLRALRTLLSLPSTTPTTKGFLLTTLFKFSVHLTPTIRRLCEQPIWNLIGEFKGSLLLELQTRACEYEAMRGFPEEMKIQLLSPIQPLEVKSDSLPAISNTPTTATTTPTTETLFSLSDAPSPLINLINPTQVTDSLFPLNTSTTSLINLFNPIQPIATPLLPNLNPIPPTQPMLGLNFMAPSLVSSMPSSFLPATSTQTPSMPPSQDSRPTPLIPIPSPHAGPLPPDLTPSFPPLIPLHNTNIKVTFTFKKPTFDPSHSLITAIYDNLSNHQYKHFSVQFAPAIHIKLSLSPISIDPLIFSSTDTLPTDEIPPLGRAQQVIKVLNKLFGEKPLMLKMKINYLCNELPVEYLITIKNFPTGL